MLIGSKKGPLKQRRKVGKGSPEEEAEKRGCK